METGTGKTYVYLKTIFELNKKYDLTHWLVIRGDTADLALKEKNDKYQAESCHKNRMKHIYRFDIPEQM